MKTKFKFKLAKEQNNDELLKERELPLWKVDSPALCSCDALLCLKVVIRAASSELQYQ